MPYEGLHLANQKNQKLGVYGWKLGEATPNVRSVYRHRVYRGNKCIEMTNTSICV